MTDKITYTPEVHGPNCKTSGKNRCQDILHIKKEWTKDDRELLVQILNNYWPEDGNK